MAPLPGILILTTLLLSSAVQADDRIPILGLGFLVDLSSFTIEHGDMIYGYAGLANATETSSTSSGTSSSITSLETSSSNETSAKTTSPTVSSQTGSTDAACATSSSGSSDDSASGGSSSTDSSSTAVGAGVGVSLGVALAGALAWGFWERRKRLQERRQVAGRMPGGGPTEPKLMYAGYSNVPRAPYPPQPPQAYSPQPYYSPQPSYSPQAAHMQPQVPRELPHQGHGAVELMDNPRQY
ncbi:hypothetical protein VMCG_08200 [Cytospora schulzeri]|uniref:Mid2 domain-containing protein n=1 Tax=Cytospora schulzeri TaxID=448051 RepID=A0A423VU33_9PEZI|nr:hypothetical protein VMCG_08200 [Valsa malicola]